ncbi:1,4-alpha-glucan branching protein GlgB [Balneolaceae bacterium ANBcel3]|nr:1,4-alpha-glucan branching protein GlgB [Balneolaceae bacterium ANBcel3]
MKKKILDDKQIRALENADHSDPFSVLGPHLVKKEKKKGIVVRTIQPNAEVVKIWYEDGASNAEMEKIGSGGVFEVFLEGLTEIPAYHFEVTPYEGDAYTIIDPYAFGPTLNDFDLQLWGEGNHRRVYEWMGSHTMTIGEVSGTRFVVAAPNARRVSVVGSFNDWDGRRHPMRKYHEQGIWEIFIPGISEGDTYKYEIAVKGNDVPMLKADPYAFYSEVRPRNASIVKNIDQYEWQDSEWMSGRTKGFDTPMSIYEVHLGSWKKNKMAPNGFLTYRELADDLVPYVSGLGFTHIELLPIAEHPYDPSWGYQITGYFAPTSRFGSPEDFMYFIDACHQAGIGVIIDWVPAHFTKDDHGLRMFDGTSLYEHADPRQGEHRDWGTLIFNYGRTEVINFLISNAVYWCDKYHIDGLRVDAVASMLYLDYSREDGEWLPNQYGGRENVEAIDFIKRFNIVLNEEFEGVITMAEESTSWPMVSRPTFTGGLGFDYKWNMGWMNDTLKYMAIDPIFRKYHHNQLTFSMIYAFTENFLLPLSHDEVVHMKRSLISKMPGDDWQKFANLRLLYTYMFAHPGKKLLFMGAEIAQWTEWNSEQSIDWGLTKYERHNGIQALIKDLNSVYTEQKALHQVDFDWSGFQWIDFSDADSGILAFMRRGKSEYDTLVCIFNFTPQVHYEYRIGVPREGTYRTIFNSDSEYYGGSNFGNDKMVAIKGDWHDQPASIKVNIPPLAGIIVKSTQ